MEQLRAIINRHMAEENIGIREFARNANLAHSMIVRILDSDNHSIPSLPTLEKIANALHLDFFTVVRAAYPADGSLDASVDALAEKISKLPADQRELVENIVSGMLLKQGKDDS